MMSACSDAHEVEFGAVDLVRAVRAMLETVAAVASRDRLAAAAVEDDARAAARLVIGVYAVLVAVTSEHGGDLLTVVADEAIPASHIAFRLEIAAVRAMRRLNLRAALGVKAVQAAAVFSVEVVEAPDVAFVHEAAIGDLVDVLLEGAVAAAEEGGGERYERGRAMNRRRVCMSVLRG